MRRNETCSRRTSLARNTWHLLSCAVCVALCVLLLAACGGLGSTKPAVKIGLSAPFEGLYRELGYEALYAVRLAVRERNAEGGVGQRYLVELVALNDLNEAETAAEQARKMAVDPAVLAVLGGFSAETALVAPEYEQLGLAFLTPAPGVNWLDSPGTADASFSQRYELLSGGAAPGPAAVWAYGTANRILNAMDYVARSSGQLTRSDVQDAVGSKDR